VENFLDPEPLERYIWDGNQLKHKNHCLVAKPTLKVTREQDQREGGVQEVRHNRAVHTLSYSLMKPKITSASQISVRQLIYV